VTVVKSDAMLQHEVWIHEVVTHRPKHMREQVMHIEVRNLVMAAAAILVVVIAAVEMLK
jgi:hypothetical protein